MSETEKRVQLTYVGRRRSHSDLKPRYCYYKGPIQDNNLFWFKSPMKKTDTIGIVVEATETPTGVKPPYEYIDQVEHPKMLGEWEAKERTDMLWIQSQKRMTKVPDSSYQTAVKELKYLYRQLNTTQRTAFLFRVIKDIEYGK